VVADKERDGRAMELGRPSPFREDVVPVRGRRPPLEECPWKADIACEFKKGIGGLRGAGESGLFVGKGVLRPDI